MFMVGVKKLHHHIYVQKQMRLDLEMWLTFLKNPTVFACPFLDFTTFRSAEEIDMYSDASRNPKLGAGGFNKSSWFALQWDEEFILECQPSIAYLELFALTITVINWMGQYKNQRIVLFCDNKSVVYMVNTNTSNCKRCLKLI